MHTFVFLLRFTAANFGKLFGLAMTVSAAVSLIQYPLFILQEKALGGNPLYVSNPRFRFRFTRFSALLKHEL